MATKTIFSINTVIPGDDFLEIDYCSNQTMLDADISLFTPTLKYFYSRYDSEYQGRIRLSDTGSFEAEEQTYHWRSEITSAANTGKFVVVYLEEPDECYRRTGKKKASGTGQNRKVIYDVTEINSYEALPFITSYSTKTGTKIKATEDGAIILPYWNEFSKYSIYRAEIDGEFSKVVLTSEVGSRVIGAMKRYNGGGAILFLPPVKFYNAEFIQYYDADIDEEDYYDDYDENNIWTEAGLQAGKRFIAAITSLAETLSATSPITPPPNWVSADQYRIPKESYLESKIIQISKNLTLLEETKKTLQQDLLSASWPRYLIYEKGAPLEDAILQSLILMGFKADGFDDGVSEFDSVFSAPEGRFIGEAEGRDSKAIGIAKFSQLERNLHEDFDREEVDEIANGVLFGNGHRLKKPEERATLFTEKCLKAAKRIGAALVQTPDMFVPTRYLVENPKDQDYATSCRKAIADAAGDIVKFPEPPIVQHLEAEKMSTDSEDD